MSKNAGNDLRLLMFSAMLAALLAVFSQISIPLIPVPVNLALLAVFLIGFLLPLPWALATVGTYLILGAVGVPVFSGFRGGLQALLGFTGGYLFGYLASALVIALLKHKADTVVKRFLLCLLALLACYLPGTLWLMNVGGMGLGKALPMAIYPFIPGDLLKCLVAALLSVRLRQALGI